MQQIEPKRPASTNPPEQFAGGVWLDLIAAPHSDDQRMTVAIDGKVIDGGCAARGVAPAFRAVVVSIAR